MTDTPASALLAEALALHRAGRLAEAEPLYRRCLAARHDNGDALGAYGLLLHHTGRHAEAAALLERVAAARPADATVHSNLAAALFALGRVGEAAALWQRARQLRPDDPDISANLGMAETRRGRCAAAIGHYRRALALQADHGAAWLGMANALRELGELTPAVAAYTTVLALQPGHAAGWNNLGLVHRRAGRLAQAVACHQRALALAASAEAAKNLGHALVALARADDAADAFRQAEALAPSDPSGPLWLAGVLREQGRVEAALDAYGRAATLDTAGFAARIRHAATMPVIAWSRQDIALHRQRLAMELEAMTADGVSVDDPYAANGPTNFFLAYHNCDDRPLQEAMARFYRQACPSLDFVAPHCRGPAPPRRARLRLGLCSAFFRHHTIGRLNLGIVRHLDRSRFEVVLIRAPGRQQDDLQQAFDQAADAVVTLPDNLAAARQRIAELELDALHYTDIGMSRLLYFLAFARLAPVQTTTWGHPDTSGLGTIDYFLSAEPLEPGGAEAHYSETLVRLPRLNVCYQRPAAPAHGDRARFGLPDGAHLYVCAQTLFKLHPDDDDLFARLLREDPAGLLVFISGRDAHWNERLITRIGRAHAGVVERIRFLPAMGHGDFMTLLATADVLLDARYFSGGNTSYEAFALATPVAAWDDAPFMRGRLTRAMYHAMALPQFCAAGDDAFVALAQSLAADPAARRAASAAIAGQAGALFDDAAAVRVLEGFFSDSCGR